MKSLLVGFMVLAVFSRTASAEPLLVEGGYSASYVGSGSGVGGYGSAVTNDDDLYFTLSGGGQVYKVDSSGTQTIYTTTSSYFSMGLAVDNNSLFVGVQNGIEIYDLSAPSTSPSFITGISGTVNDIIFASSNSIFDGSIMVATNNGLYAIDSGTNVITTVASGIYNGVEFANDGSLFATQGTGLTHILADGSLDYNFSSSSLDGIAIHDGTNEIFLSNSSNGSILRFDTDSLTTTTFASNIPFDAGWYPSPLEFSSDGTELFYGERGIGNGSNGSIWSINGFSEITVASVSEASSVYLLAFGLLGLFVASRKV